MASGEKAAVGLVVEALTVAYGERVALTDASLRC